MPIEPWGVVLAGGIGSRFWPLSTPERPKQLLPLVTDQPMLLDTLDRLAPLAPPERTLVLTNASLVESIRRIAPGLPRANVISEPRPAGTAAALTWAAQEVSRRSSRETVIVSVHADWAIGDVAAFRAVIAAAATAAQAHHALVTVGLVPTHPDSSLGHIVPGDAVEGDLRRVARFVEKPGKDRAARLTQEGALWNSGIFAWRAGDILEEVTARCPEVASALEAHPAEPDAFFAAVTPVAIDVGVLERSDRVLVLPGSFGWNDVGTWSALRAVRKHDADGNVRAGLVYLRDSRGMVVHSDGPAVVCYGVEDLVVVVANGTTLVTTVERAPDMKSLLASLPESVRGP